MRKQHVVNLVLFAAIVMLGVVVWFDPFAPAPPEELPLTNTSSEAITAITLIKEGKTAFRVEKYNFDSEPRWKLTQPVDLSANLMKVKQLLSLLKTNSLRQYRIKSDNLAKLGLAEPAWQIVFDVSHQIVSTTSASKIPVENVVIKFGKTEPVSQKRYVLVDDTIHLINDRVSQFTFGSPLMLANLDILPVDKSVKEVHLPDKVIRRVDGQWESSSPAEQSVSQSTYKEFIDEWRYAQASRVALADKAESNSEAKPVTVVLEQADQPIHFMVESSGADFIVTNKDWGVRYYLNSSVGEKLLHVTSPTSKEQ